MTLCARWTGGSLLTPLQPRAASSLPPADGAERASALTHTQAEAIAKAKELDPNAKPNVARVEKTKGGGPDKF